MIRVNATGYGEFVLIGHVLSGRFDGSFIPVFNYSLLMLMFQNCRQAAGQAGSAVAVESQGDGSPPECPIVHQYDPCVLCPGDWARTEEGSCCCCLQAAVAADQWAEWQVHPGSNGQRHCCWTGLGNGGRG